MGSFYPVDNEYLSYIHSNGVPFNEWLQQRETQKDESKDHINKIEQKIKELEKQKLDHFNKMCDKLLKDKQAKQKKSKDSPKKSGKSKNEQSKKREVGNKEKSKTKNKKISINKSAMQQDE